MTGTRIALVAGIVFLAAFVIVAAFAGTSASSWSSC